MVSKQECVVTDCKMKAVFTVVPMTSYWNEDLWDDEDGNPAPACRSHLTDTIMWMSQSYSHWHVRNA